MAYTVDDTLAPLDSPLPPDKAALPKAAILIAARARHIIYPPAVEQALRGIANLVLDIPSDEPLEQHARTLAGVELLFTGWGGVSMTAEVLALFPSLRGVFYGAGSIRPIVTDAFWERHIPVCSAASLNAIPVAEYVFAQIILCLKQGHHLARMTRDARCFTYRKPAAPLGSYKALIGLVSFGEIARQLLTRLRTLDVQVQVYDPYLSLEKAREFGVRKVDLATLFRTSDVASVHTPRLPETIGLITEELLASLKPGATFINTARGIVVDEPALGRVMAARPDLQAIIDVTFPEPPEPASPLYSLPNVFLTPHIAGSLDRECERMGSAMVDEARRLLTGHPLKLSVTREAYLRMA